jgi:hypothetical protein
MITIRLSKCGTPNAGTTADPRVPVTAEDADLERLWHHATWTDIDEPFVFWITRPV